MYIKSQLVLYIYENLYDKKTVKTEDIMAEFNVSMRTVRRYISEINSYLRNFNKNKEVHYSRSKKSYVLKEL